MTNPLISDSKGAAFFEQVMTHYFSQRDKAEEILGKFWSYPDNEAFRKDLILTLGGEIVRPLREIIEEWETEFLILLRDRGEEDAHIFALQIGFDLAAIAHGALVHADWLERIDNLCFRVPNDYEGEWHETYCNIMEDVGCLRWLAQDCNKLQTLMTGSLAKVVVDSSLRRKEKPIDPEEHPFY